MRREGERRTPSWALRHTRCRTEGGEGEVGRGEDERGKRRRKKKLRGKERKVKRSVRQVNKRKESGEEIAEERERMQQNRDRQIIEIIEGKGRKRGRKDSTRSHREQTQREQNMQKQYSM